MVRWGGDGMGVGGLRGPLASWKPRSPLRLERAFLLCLCGTWGAQAPRSRGPGLTLALCLTTLASDGELSRGLSNAICNMGTLMVLAHLPRAVCLEGGNDS